MNFIFKFFVNRELDKVQEEIRCGFEKNGLTDEILENQIAINTVRNLLDIPDSKEKVYKKYTQ